VIDVEDAGWTDEIKFCTFLCSKEGQIANIF